MARSARSAAGRGGVDTGRDHRVCPSSSPLPEACDRNRRPTAVGAVLIAVPEHAAAFTGMRRFPAMTAAISGPEVLFRRVAPTCFPQ